MQTFLPYRDFAKSASVLDRQRLGKQRVETMQIMKSLATGSGWSNHPAVKMWEGFAECLMEYQLSVCSEWIEVRGYNDTCLDKTFAIFETLDDSQLGEGLVPHWFDNDDFFVSHRSNLIRKKPEHYRKFWPDVSDNLEYIWPV